MLAQIHPFFSLWIKTIHFASGMWRQGKMHFEAKFIILWLQFLQQYAILPNPTSFFLLKSTDCILKFKFIQKKSYPVRLLS